MGQKNNFNNYLNGFFNTGKVGKNEFSVDGKSFDYRDPKNLKNAQVGSINDRGITDDQKYNPNSYNYTDPLYDYSKGEVRDAAKELGIGNVDEKSEVKQIIDRIQNSSAETKEKKEDKPKKFLDNYIDKNIKNESTKAEVEIPTAKGDNSINSPITQANAQTVTGDNDVVTQNNAIKQSIDSRVNKSDNSSRMFLDNFKLNLGSKLNLRNFS
jgi:hypothetical protein